MALNARKFNVLVSEIPVIPQEKLERFKHKHINDSYIHDHNCSEAKARNATCQLVADLQYQRWAWAEGNQWKYINVLRANQFSDDNIQDMCNATRPLAFSTRQLHEEYCKSLGELAKDLEKEYGWKNIRFIQTGSSVVGFSTNPLKGLADRPTKITSVDSSDVDVVIVAEGLKEWLDKCHAEGKKFLGHEYPTTRTQTTFGHRKGCKTPTDVDVIKDWWEVWSKKLSGGVQITFDTEPHPKIPPWESWIQISGGKIKKEKDKSGRKKKVKN